MLCPVITEKTLEKCHVAVENFSLAEIRLDLCLLSLEDAAALFSSTKTPLIATFRPIEEINESKRVLYYEIAIVNGAAYIDIEENIDNGTLQTLISLCKKHGCKLILSYHNSERTPLKKELGSIINKAFKNGADLVKISCISNAKKDNKRLLSLYEKYDNIIAFAMGEKGKTTRVASLSRGAHFAYVAISKDKIVAPGQLSIEEFKKELSRKDYYLGFAYKVTLQNYNYFTNE